MEPLITVIIPVYNVESYIKDCVNSILAQTYQNLEIILVDDGSSDRSYDMCEVLTEMDNRVIALRHQKNQGVSAARNTGLLHARGEYIYFSDADDYHEKDTIEYLFNIMTADPDTELAACGYYVDTKAVPKSWHEQFSTYRKEQAAMAIAGMNENPVKGYLWNKLFKTEIIKKNNVLFEIDLAICEDALFCQAYMLYANQMVFGSCSKYHYIRRGDSATKSRLSVKRVSVLDAYKRIIQNGKNYNSLTLNKVLEANYFNHHISLMKIGVTFFDNEQREYLIPIADNIRTNWVNIIRNPYIAQKRKALGVFLYFKWILKNVF